MKLRSPALSKIFFSVTLLGLLASCMDANAPLHPQTAISSGALSAKQAKYDVKHYRLELRIDPDRKFIEGKMSMQAFALEELFEIELDLDPRFDVMSASVNGLNTTYQTSGGKLLLSAAVEQGAEFLTSVVYSGRPYAAENPPWDGGFVWSRTREGEHWIATAVQSRGCDLYWPCKDHVSDKPERGADMLITVPSNLVAVMNGKLVSEQVEGNWKTFHWQTKNPISAYHLAINVGPFKKYILQHQNTLTGDASIPVIFYHVSDDMEKIEKLIRDDFIGQLTFFERMLGPYPWGNEKIGIVEIPYLGMEHQTMNGYGNGFALDSYGFDWLMQHEFSHEWFGNLMTQSEGRDFWLHEGFANYMQPVYAQYVIGDAGYWSYMWDFYNKMANCKPVLPDEEVSLDYFESNDIYNKGSWVLHTLRGIVGEDVFWRSIRRLIYGTVDPWSLTYPIKPTRRSSEDFINIVSEEYGENLGWFFDLYLRKKELPVLKQERTEAGIQFNWQNNSAIKLDIPIIISYNGSSTSHDVAANGELFPVPFAAVIQVDPQTQILRNFGTTEPCILE